MSDVSPAPSFDKKTLNAHLWERDENDYYTEPSWISERLLKVEDFEDTILDPACGSGRIVRSARSLSYEATGGDIIERCDECEHVGDFLTYDYQNVDCIISNPPFSIAEEFARRALKVARRKVALILPTMWMHGDARSRWLEDTPLRRIYILRPRPSMPPGRVIEAGISPGGGKKDFAIFVWHQNYDGRPEIVWLRKND